MEAELLEGPVVESESTEELLRERRAFDKTRGFLLSAVVSGCSGVGVGAASREIEEALRLQRSTLIVYRPGGLGRALGVEGRISNTNARWAQLRPMQSSGARYECWATMPAQRDALTVDVESQARSWWQRICTWWDGEYWCSCEAIGR